MPRSVRHRLVPATVAAVFLALGACGRDAQPETPQPVIPALSATLGPVIAAEMPEAYAAATAELATANEYHPFFVTAAMQKTFGEPWAAMQEAEARGLRLIDAGTRGLGGLPEILQVMLESLGKASGRAEPLPTRKGEGLEAYADQVEAILAATAALQSQALAALAAHERAALFSGAGAFAREFSHQVAYSPERERHLANDRSVSGTVDQRVDWVALSAAVQTLLLATDPDFLAGLEDALRAAAPRASEIRAITGSVLLVRDTPYGRIVFGGPGANVYRLDAPVAFLADLGGEDRYTGMIAASFDAAHVNAVVVDFAGNDRYEGSKMGTATGRLGVGLLLDRAGDDHYELAEASGGVGLAGVGLLVDESGDDTYIGSRLTQGAALAGIGLLYDLDGDDVHTSHGLSLGFGGPVGAGLVLDVAGEDRYQAGHEFASVFNATEAPDAGVQDPAYQWQAMSMGAGVGRRMLSDVPAHHAYAMAGGVGMLIDAAGDDHYDSGNFSQGCGYYFGLGLKLDAAGRDDHGAARYGQGAGVHYGMGAFVDYRGVDTYRSSGPIHNGGGAFDHGVGLFVDAGPEDDTYAWSRSEALGRADLGAVAIFADLGGDDRYATQAHPGRADRTSAAIFYDASGEDDYSEGGGSANGTTTHDGQGGLFLDR